MGMFSDPQLAYRSRPTRGAWIEIEIQEIVVTEQWSRPTRGAWIEILRLLRRVKWDAVAPHTGRVD